MTRQITQFVTDRIKQWEGVRLTAYKDSAGVWTIGYGHTGADVRAGLTITAGRAETILQEDLARFEEAVERLVKVPLSDNQFGALVSFAFNVGVGAFERSTLLRKLNGGDYNAVPEQLARWVHAGGKRLQGLVNRRAAEAGLWATGAFVASAPVEAAPPPSALLTGQSAAATAGFISAIATAASTPGPLQWLFGVLLAVSYGASGLLWLARQRESAR